jgi:hypothetical protein
MLPEWHKAYKAHARRDKQIGSPLGCIRHLPLMNFKNREARAKSNRHELRGFGYGDTHS